MTITIYHADGTIKATYSGCTALDESSTQLKFKGQRSDQSDVKDWVIQLLAGESYSKK